MIINNYDAIMIQPKFPSMGAGGSGDIFNNTIAKNTNTIMINGPLDLRLNHNNIFESTNYLVRLDSTSDINATNNWWGITNITTISQSIHDFYDDFNLGKVNYDNFLVAPNPATPIIPTFTIQASAGAGGSISPNGTVTMSYGSNQTFTVTPNTGYQIVSVLMDGVRASAPYTFTNIITNGHTISATFGPNPTPTPTPTPSPSPAPSPSPTPSPTATPTNAPTQNPTTQPSTIPSPTSTIPEFPSLLLLMVLVGLISLSIFTIRKRNKRFLNVILWLN